MSDEVPFLVLGASKANFDTISAMAGIPGVRLVVTDGDRNSVCRDLPRVFEAADITSGPAVLAVARKHAVQGIYAMNDHALRAAAYATDRLGLKGMSMATVHAALDKGDG